MELKEIVHELQYETEKRKLIVINGYIDSLIDIAHNSYMSTKIDEEKTILDERIKAYWMLKDRVENILKDFYKGEKK